MLGSIGAGLCCVQIFSFITVLFQQTVGEYCHLDAALVPDSVISCLLHWYRHCTSSQVRKWILSALCKRRDIIQRPSEALEILKTASNTNDKNLLQVYKHTDKNDISSLFQFFELQLHNFCLL